MFMDQHSYPEIVSYTLSTATLPITCP